ncbi:similar to Saccharomyces cerevisiae YDR435C PPM1 Carboxyl methyltransferase [Maudiozyma saulgeensis]|uniref:Leucine carboxyl methyltransferase 1 n=1 Tax=Maudiozyma saulgeensis TaxID=1789683 RepID=A0A1X7R5K4_9SACH|nr:similar to Saccharomyces cerevisiae YDR435C PPM1 Carboxyl methyltransferase [Kazachstania saulgeensis]
MERIIQQTDYDALSSKICALQFSYLPPNKGTLSEPIDETLQSLYQDIKSLHFEYYKTLKEESRNVYGKINKLMRNPFPVMNYGTYLRTLAIDVSLIKFINSFPIDQHFQIVNLGSGSDLRFIQYLNMFGDRVERFIDLDFKDAIILKQKILKDSITLDHIIQSYRDKFVMLPGDLKNVAGTLEKLTQFLNPKIPTIFITECVLCYMTENDSKQLVSTIMNEFPTGCWISYDPIGGSDVNDKFGTIMKRNLMDSRNLEMPTLLIYNSKSNYPQRWDNGKSEIVIKDMWDFLSESISDIEKKRLRSLQFLDEIEELKIMQSHYVILNTTWT